MLDHAAVRRKMLQLNKGGGANPFMFKPAEGKQVIRIVPNMHLAESSLPFEELYFYYNLQEKPILSPLSYGEADPIAEYYRELTKGQKLPREEWEKIKVFKAQMRTYAPIIVRGKENEGVKFWAFGKTVYLRLLETLNEPDYGDITDIKSGRDIVVTYTPKDKSDTNFAKTDILIKPNTSSLHTDAQAIDKLLKEQPKLVDQFDHMTYEQLKQVVEVFLNDPFENQPESPEDVMGSPTAELAHADTEAANALDAEFDSVFDKD